MKAQKGHKQIKTTKNKKELSMFSLSKMHIVKRSIFASVCAAFLVFGGFFLIKSSTESSHTNAITSNDDWVVVEAGRRIPYEGWATNYFQVTSGNNTYTAYCAQPGMDTPSGSYQAILLDGNPAEDANNIKMIKLLIAIATVDDGQDVNAGLMNILYDSLIPDGYDAEQAADLRYAYVHATIGYIYGGDTTGLSQSTISYFNSTIIPKLQNIIIGNDDDDNDDERAWALAKNYKLFKTKVEDGSVQAAVWIENDSHYGSINISKCDSETNSCSTPQGKGNFGGIKFEIYNANGDWIYNPQDKHFYNDGDLITQGTTNSNGQITFANLPTGIKYRVREVSTNASYLLTALDQTMSDGLTTNGITFKFYDDILRGDVKFTKIDSDNGEPMSNVVFRIQSNTTNEAHLVVTDDNGLVDTSASHALHTNHTNGYDNIEESSLKYLGYGTWFGAIGAVNNDKGALPYDIYTITELECDANKFCYDIGTAQKTVTINKDNTVVDLDDWDNDCADFSLGTTATDASDGDKFIKAGTNSIIKDTIAYCVMPGKNYTIKGVLMDKKTGQELKINGQSIINSITIEPAKDNDKCGTAEMDFKFDSSMLGGSELVVFESIYYDDELVISHEDINDINQTVNIVKLGTTATDNSDGDKILAVDENVELKDEIKYCLRANTEFTINGTVMNKKTKEPLMIGGKKIEQVIKITPEEACGTAEMVFSFNTEGLGGVDLVVFEEVYYGKDLVISHSDFNDEGQTISVAPPTPDTGYTTKVQDYSTTSFVNIALIATFSTTGIYAIFRASSRRKILNKR